MNIISKGKHKGKVRIQTGFKSNGQPKYSYIHPDELATCLDDNSVEPVADPYYEAKDDKDKLDLTMIYWPAIDRLAKVYQFGAQKYSRDSWTEVPDGIERYKAALLRHVHAIMMDGINAINEEDGGVRHLDQIIWNAVALEYFADAGERED